jgi:RNA recognition motif-containing protein
MEMTMQIYVGNLSPKTTDEELKKMFQVHGQVRAATVGVDKKSGDPLGYGFVDMPVKSEARKAIEALRGKKSGGKALLVRALKPDDEFHQHALAMQGGGKAGAAPTGFRGNVVPRGSGAIRRSGRRGS